MAGTSTCIPSTAASPDLDWSQIRETVLMLNLAVAHIEGSMREGDESINALTHSFTTMAGYAQVIGMAATRLPPGEEQESILNNCRAISEKMNAAIMAFQFYDKLAQRLGHVAHSLSALGELVSNSKRLYSPYEWCGLQEKIKSTYTTQAEREMFDAIVNGRDVEEALQLMKKNRETQRKDDIELF